MYARFAVAEAVHRGAFVVYMSAVECSESFECKGENVGRERDFGFWRGEGMYAPNSRFVECYGETLPNLTLPEEFENLVWVRRSCEGSHSSGSMFIHDPFIIEHSDGIVFLDAVNEHPTNAFHRVLHRQTEEGGKSWVVNVLLKEE